MNLPRRLRAKGWKVKVREKERLEPPHVTIICRKKEWRVGLRDASFLVPPGGKWGDIDKEVRDHIQQNWQSLQEAWDAKYPSNPIESKVDDDDENG